MTKDMVMRAYEDVSSTEGQESLRPRMQPPEVSWADTRPNVSTLIVSPRLRVSAAIMRPTRVFRLRGIFVMDAEQLEDGTVFVKHRELPVYGYGETFTEAVAGFNEMFEMQWCGLVESNESELTDEAREVRNQFRNIVESIHPIA